MANPPSKTTSQTTPNIVAAPGNPTASCSAELESIDDQILALLMKRFQVLSDRRSDMNSKTTFPNLRDHQHSIATFALRWLDNHPASCDASSMQCEVLIQLLKNIAGTMYQQVKPPTQIAYLGPIYSYSYLAATKFFGESSALVPVGTIPAVFEEVMRDQSHWGVVPIENSTDGRIVDTLTMLAKLPVKICGEVLLPIHHYLLGLGSRSSIREVYSKPQALSQCRNWLHEHLPDAKWVEVSSTTTAASMAAEDPSRAAIASQEAGIHHGLKAIDACIEDNTMNVTRFAILGNELPTPTGHDKTSLLFRVPHQPGALADAMLLFRERKLNLTWIESFPIPGSPSEYLFFVELEGHQSQSEVASAIIDLRRQCLRLEVLGSYPRATANGSSLKPESVELPNLQK